MKAYARTIDGILRIALTLTVCFAVVSCAMTRQTRSVKQSGFLSNYSQLREGEGDEAQWIYINPVTKFSAYDKVMFDPISIWLIEGSEMSDVPSEELQQLVVQLGRVLVASVQPEYEIVDRAGPGVMKIRVAITEAQSSKVALDVLTSAIPNFRTIATGIGLATDTQFLVGKAAVEMEILDSVSGVRMVAAVDERAGTKSIRGSTRTWGDVKEAYDYWGERLRIRLAELRAGQ